MFYTPRIAFNAELISPRAAAITLFCTGFVLVVDSAVSTVTPPKVVLVAFSRYKPFSSTSNPAPPAWSRFNLILNPALSCSLIIPPRGGIINEQDNAGLRIKLNRDQAGGAGLEVDENGLYLEKATSTTLGGVTVDTALSTTSTNPVQNKVIAAALGDISSALNAILGV